MLARQGLEELYAWGCPQPSHLVVTQTAAIAARGAVVAEGGAAEMYLEAASW